MVSPRTPATQPRTTAQCRLAGFHPRRYPGAGGGGCPNRRIAAPMTPTHAARGCRLARPRLPTTPPDRRWSAPHPAAGCPLRPTGQPNATPARGCPSRGRPQSSRRLPPPRDPGVVRYPPTSGSRATIRGSLQLPPRRPPAIALPGVEGIPGSPGEPGRFRRRGPDTHCECWSWELVLRGVWVDRTPMGGRTGRRLPQIQSYLLLTPSFPEPVRCPKRHC
jgi:hypothetical protein